MRSEEELQETVKQLREYDRFLEQLKQLQDRSTGNSVMEEIRNLFQKIRAKRLKPKMRSK